MIKHDFWILLQINSSNNTEMIKNYYSYSNYDQICLFIFWKNDGNSGYFAIPILNVQEIFQE